MAIETRINKDKTLTHRVRVKLPNGKWVNGGSYGDALDAQSAETKLKKKLRIGEGSVLALEDGRRTAVDEYYQVWRHDRRSTSGAGWWISKDQMFRDYVSPVIGQLMMSKVGIPDISRVLVAVREKGRSAQTERHVYSLLNSMFSDALEFYRMIEESPVVSKFHRNKVAKAFVPFLTPTAAWKLLSYVRSPKKPRDLYLARPIWIQLLAGARVEAIQGLQWKSVLWDSNQILICRAWKQKTNQMADYPKGKDWEYIPMIPALKSFLLSEWQIARNPEAFVCPGIKGGMLPYETYLRAIKRMCKQAGVPEIATHGARHSCTELWIEAGASAEDVRRLLNQKSLSSTAGYIHRTEERLQTLGKRVELRVIDGGSFPGSFPIGEQMAERGKVSG